ALAGLSVGTALGLAGTTGRRRAAVVALRLAAFLLALVAIARPALGFLDTSQPPSQLFVLVDFSKSMTIQDESGKESRWQLLLRTLKKSEPALQRLREEQQVEVLFHKFAGDVEPFDPAAPGEADGKRTDYGAALRKLADGRDPRARLRGLLLI